MGTLDDNDLAAAGRLPDDPTEGTELLDWDPPMDFRDDGLLPTFPVEVFPPPVAEFIVGLSRQIRTPPDLAAMLVLATISAAVAGKARVRPAEGWLEPLNIYAVVSMPPGSGKSPVFKKVVKPIEDHERQLAEEARPRNQELASTHRILEARRNKLEQEVAKANTESDRRKAKGGLDAVLAEQRATPYPVEPRLLIGDATLEKLAQIMAEQGGRIASMSAEGGLFDVLAGRYSSSGLPNIDVALQAWSEERIRVDRIGREPLVIDWPSLTIAVTVQPTVLDMLGDKPRLRGRGVMARFLFAVPPSRVGRREPNPPSLSQRAADEYHAWMRSLVESQVPPPGELPTLRLSEGARELFRSFNVNLEPRLGEEGDLGGMQDWAGKLQSHLVRVAGLLHCVENGDLPLAAHPPIATNTMRNALKVIDYLIPHAKAAYRAMSLDSQVGDALYVIRWIERQPRSHFTVRNAFQSLKGRFPQVRLLEPVLDLLERHHYLRRAEPVPRPGRRGRKPSPTYMVNPLWVDVAAQNAQKSQKSRSEDCGDSER